VRGIIVIGFSVAALMLVMACAENDKNEEKKILEKGDSGMKLLSSAFNEGEMIPEEYTCDSVDVSPELLFEGIPEGTKSLALICDDPDAPSGLWVHWVIFNIAPVTQMLPRDISKDLRPVIGGDSSNFAIQGRNDFGRYGYGGPCPPRGPAHRYFFKLYALDMELEFETQKIEEGITAKGLMVGMKDHIIDSTSLMGKYKR